MPTIFKYRERVHGKFTLLFRVGFLDEALDVLSRFPAASPEDVAARQALLRVGARLRRRGEIIDKNAHEAEALASDNPVTPVEVLVRGIDLPHLRDGGRWLQHGPDPWRAPCFSVRRACHYAEKLRTLGMSDADIAGLISDLYWDAVTEMNLNRATAAKP